MGAPAKSAARHHRAARPFPRELFGYRFEECCTGGNCVGLIAELPGGGHVLATAYDEAQLPTARDWALGFYDADIQQLRLACSDGTNEVTP